VEKVGIRIDLAFWNLLQLKTLRYPPENIMETEAK